jgi:hypothetical protein
MRRASSPTVAESPHNGAERLLASAKACRCELWAFVRGDQPDGGLWPPSGLSAARSSTGRATDLWSDGCGFNSRRAACGSRTSLGLL